MTMAACVATIRFGMSPGLTSAIMGGSISCERRSRTTAGGMHVESASQPNFTDLIGRLHRDDREAIDLLVERYGGALRRSIERAFLVRRLSGPGGGRDPADPEVSDIFQTVFVSFLIRLRRQRDGSSGALSFEAPGQLVAYLKAIAEHEMNRRSPRSEPARAVTGPAASTGREPTSDEPTPSQALMARELLERDGAALAEFARRLSPEERAMWELVRLGLGWPDIARRLGGPASPEAVRKAFARAVRRIADDLRSRGVDHEPD
jgi:DNA-directed RNA polymerase specialized sigma24 family protein